MAVETDMGTVRDVVGQCLSLRRDFNLNKVKADGESRSYFVMKINTFSFMLMQIRLTSRKHVWLPGIPIYISFLVFSSKYTN